MSIKSDRWIRRMAQEHAVIEPFEDRQVRQLDAQGRQVISYGVSSYGYDIRVAAATPASVAFFIGPKHFESLQHADPDLVRAWLRASDRLECS